MAKLVSETTAQWLREQMAPGQNASRPRRIFHPAKPSRPMPFDCRLEKDSNDEEHVFVYLPDKGAKCVTAFAEEVQPDQVLAAILDEQDGPWYDLGEFSGQVLLRLTTDQTTARDEGDGGMVTGAGIYYSLLVDTQWPHTPNRNPNNIRIGPGVPIFTKDSSGETHQLHHGAFVWDFRVADGEDSFFTTTAYNPYYASLDQSVKGRLQLHEFDDPTIVENPWREGGTPPAETDYLVPVRHKVGNTYQVHYTKLSDMGPEPPTPVEPYDPEQDSRFEDWFELTGKPCETDAAYYVYDPCADEGERWTSMADTNVFWKTGGDSSSCRGDSIGNGDGDEIINLGGSEQGTFPTLKGPVWNCEGAFNCEGSVNSEIGFYVYSGQSGCDMGPSGDLTATEAVHTKVVECTRIIFGGDEFEEKEITYLGTDGRPHTETILAKQ